MLYMHFPPYLTEAHSRYRTTLFNVKVLKFYKAQIGDGVSKLGSSEIHFIESGV